VRLLVDGPEERPNKSIRTGPEVQAVSRWTPPTGTLGRICAEAAARCEALRGRRAELERLAETTPAGPSLRAALEGAPAVAVIAEIKRASPSRGAIRLEIDAAAQARAYQEGGAAAISVLTEPLHFAGRPADLTTVRAAVSLPALKKDFHVAPVQLLEARALGASAALLIARAVSPRVLRELVDEATRLGIEPLVEVRDLSELERALEAGASLIGVNNRDLETLVIDSSTVERIVPRVPPTCVAIAESGMREAPDVERAARAGADAVLVGSAFALDADPAAAVRRLTGVGRHPRG